ncbi:hypothetical protein L6R52_20335 [Myxococcota bacterium]|nr:hypothetical protein [Myxococcota bacterium]
MSTELRGPSAALVIVALSLVASGARAQTPATPSVDEVRTTARALLQTMCGAQCDVIDVKIKNKRATPTGAPLPGFDEAPPVRWVPGEVELTILFDSKLEAAYRRFVAERVRHRIGELGLPVLVNEQARPFPAPPEPPTEAAKDEPARDAPQPPAPVIIQAPEREPAPAPEPAPVDLGQALALRLIEAVPLLLGFLLLAWLVLRVLRRMEDLAARPTELVEPAPPVEPAPEPAVVEAVLPPPDAAALREELRTHRSSTRRVFQRLLLRGEHETVARAVAVLGDEIVADLAADPSLRGALAEAGARTAVLLAAPLTEEARDDVLRRLQAELVGDRVAHRADDTRRELEALLGWGPEAFAALLGRLDDRQRTLLLRHAPTHLTEAWLGGLAGEVRRDLVRRLVVAPAAEPDELVALGRTVDAERPAALVGGYEAEHLVELLDALPAAEQEALVSELEVMRPDFVRRHLGRLPVESALLRVPPEALAAAWASVPIEDWITYLRVAPSVIKERALGACPARLEAGLVEELGLRVVPDPLRATEARRRIVRAAIAATPAGGRGAKADAPVVSKSEAGPARGSGREVK